MSKRQSDGLRSTLNLSTPAALALAFSLLTPAPTAQAKLPARTVKRTVKMVRAEVTRVVDGDTVHALDSDGEVIKIRMQGVDAPESKLPTDQGIVGQMPWGKASSDSLTRMLPKGSRVQLEVFGTDKYGRTIAHVLLQGKNLNIEQLRKGHAVSYIICEPGECSEKYLDEVRSQEIIEACHAAQKAELGIFDRENPLGELPFEFRLRLQNRTPDKFVGDITTREYFDPQNYRSVPICDRIFFMSEADAQAVGFTKHLN
jgi:endonuclease YncB( thermonuclease family)